MRKISMYFIFFLFCIRIVFSSEDNSIVIKENESIIGPQVSSISPNNTPKSSRVQDGEKFHLSLEEVSRLALQNSLDIQIAQFDLYIKETSLLKVESIFDAYLDMGAGYRNNQLQPSSKFMGDKTVESSVNLGLQKKFQSGTAVRIEALGKKTDSNSEFIEVNPQQEARAAISVLQPLGKNYFGLQDKSTIKITKIDIKNAEYTSLNDIETALYRVQLAYWNLVLKKAELAIKEDMLKESEKLYGIYKDRFDIGLSEKVDLLAVRSNMLVRENEVMEAKLRLVTAKNNLLFLLNTSDTSIEIDPGDSLTMVPSTYDFSQALTTAIENRRDYFILKNMLDMNNIALDMKKNALWPEIDLQASLTRNGITRKFVESWSEMIENNNTEFFVGVTFKMPLGNSLARAELHEKELEKQKLLLTLKQLERLILREMNNRVSEINSITSQLQVAGEIVQLQEAKLDEELKRLGQGRSNADFIIRYGNDVLDARIAQARSFFRYRVALLDLNLSQNILLDQYWEE